MRVAGGLPAWALLDPDQHHLSAPTTFQLFLHTHPEGYPGSGPGLGSGALNSGGAEWWTCQLQQAWAWLEPQAGPRQAVLFSVSCLGSADWKEGCSSEQGFLSLALQDKEDGEPSTKQLREGEEEGERHR